MPADPVGDPEPQAVAGIQAMFQQALDLHRQGNLTEASRLYEEILEQEPEHFDALHLLGMVAVQTGRIELGLGLFDQAIALEPNYAAAFSNRGNALRDLGRFEDALASYDQAVALKPDYAVAYSNRGNALHDLRRLQEALASYDTAIALDPDYAPAYSNRGNALRDLGRFEDALASYDQAVALKPDYAEAYSNRGNAQRDLKRSQEALASYDTAIALAPDYAAAYSNRGNALRDLGRFEDALASYDQAVALKPDYAEAYSNRGNAQRDLKRLEEALASYGKAIALAPAYVEAYSNAGTVLLDLNRTDESLVSYDKAITLNPEFAEAHWNKSHALLTLGRLDQGWRLYEWRKRLPEPLGADAYPQPLWLGAESLAGKTIFLHWEQGLGDTIQFCRYANLVQARGARVVMSVQDALLRLMKPLEPQIEIIGGQTPPAAFDFHAPLMSLPLAFGTTLETIPAEPRYLAADPDLAANWAARLPPRTRPRIGLVWSGSTTHKNDHNRSIALRELQPLLSFDADWVCLQKEIRERDAPALQQHGAIHVFGEALGDFADTAALIEQLDLVITVDTSTAHLAGALGKPVWVLLPFMPDFRWLLDRQDCPWYPSARLFRQPRVGDWASVVERVKGEVATRFDQGSRKFGDSERHGGMQNPFNS